MAQESDSEQLRAELRSLADTLEEVLRSSSEKSKAEMEKLRDKAEAVLKESREKLDNTGEQIINQTREAAQSTETYIRTNPWTSVGFSAAVGIVLGLLLSRR
ncbi:MULTISPECIES: DUF883 family protein [Musicola]|uniref:DUF883 domain-containing protein n=1 Tax=Musicola paradisiaca (strain Ech703) TaxID=579405 RepID=C6CE58_MUSP7|nr:MULTISPECIES: YqjD family protein [Musicola]ACS87152.1 protein of unknown function DUF883 ElaB [Musicola paradisiaca Ech703]